MSYTTGIELGKIKNKGYSLEQAFRKAYLGRPTIHIPKCLWGKKIKLILCEDEKENEICIDRITNKQRHEPE